MSVTKLILGLSLFLLFSVFILFPQKSYASNIIFQENFDSQNIDGWIIGSNNCLFNGSPAEWRIVNGALGMKIDGGTCYSDIAPSNSFWNSSLNDYTVEFDMILVSGTDHHFAFRYSDTNSWYNFHIQSPSNIIFQRMSESSAGNIIHGDFSNGQTIHFKIILNSDHISVYTGNGSETLIYDNPQMGNYYPLGKIALQATAGGDPNSETYFDNIVVTSLDNVPTPTNSPTPTPTPTPIFFNLNVPLLKQTAEPWKRQIYDSANKWSPSNPTIEDWGCALVSGAMILNYYGINKLPNGEKLDPGTLNSWLKNQKDGYLDKGWLNWLALSRLSKLSKSINHIKDFDALQYTRSTTTDNIQLTEDLWNKHPDILEESGHFIVAKGINGDTFNINDPYFNIQTLKDGYSNTYLNLGRYIPSFTDLSYIMLSTDLNRKFSIIDNNNNSKGQIYIEKPLINDSNILQKGSPIQLLYFSTPSTNKYEIKIDSSVNGLYKLNVYSYDKNGNANIFNLSGITDLNKIDYYTVNFDKDNSNNSTIVKNITFKDIIYDINLGKKQKLISPLLSDRVIRLITTSEKDYDSKKNKQSLLKIETAIHLIEISNNHFLIKEDFFRVIIYDLKSLIKTTF